MVIVHCTYDNEIYIYDKSTGNHPDVRYGYLETDGDLYSQLSYPKLWIHQPDQHTIVLF
jgi:hypothetical protein